MKSQIKTASFTGYRPHKMPFGFDEAHPDCVRLKARLSATIESLIGEGYADFISGGSLGCDLFAAEAVLAHRELYSWVKLEIAIPFCGQADRWAPEYRARYARLLEQADRLTMISREYDKGCMFRRNRYLVDRCDCLIAVYDGLPGGTAFTVGYAHERHRRILLIEPSRAEASA